MIRESTAVIATIGRAHPIRREPCSAKGYVAQIETDQTPAAAMR
jgi:hypothetical protein